MSVLFWFDRFLEAIAEIWEKSFVGFLEDLKTPEGDFEINCPLVLVHYFHFRGSTYCLILSIRCVHNLIEFEKQMKLGQSVVWVTDPVL